MPLTVYNTLTGRKEPFTPLVPPRVGMYVCGVTVYDLCHIGHARAAIVFDVVSRYLRYTGFDVTYVRNVTDIDDKIIRRAAERNVAWNQIAESYTAELRSDMARLGVADPDIEPLATEHIGEMIEMIARLVERGHAYASEGSVYFAVESFPEYGVLSGRNIEELQAGARVEVDETKRNPLDFALWKACKPGEPAWDSPWGPGRPGWHIECSAMGRKYLGEVFDIHGGGKDLVFPHHENEIAQSHASSGSAPVRYWIHNGFVTVNAEKMSKSLGNFFTIQDLLADHHPEALRYFLLTSHYRSPIDFADDYLHDAFRHLARVYDLLAFARGLDGFADATADPAIKERFADCMDDDFNTATALAELSTLLRRLNTLRADMGRLKKKSADYQSRQAELLSGAAALVELGGVLGLFQADPAAFLEAAKDKKLAEAGMSREQVGSMIADRTAARAGKDFARSDAIRDELLAKGIKLHDGVDGTGWSVAYE